MGRALTGRSRMDVAFFCFYFGTNQGFTIPDTSFPKDGLQVSVVLVACTVHV